MTNKNRLNYPTFVKDSYNYIEQNQEQIIKDYLLKSYERFNIDQKTGIFSWGDNEKNIVEAEFEAVGSFSLVDNSWLWAWKNDTLFEKITREIQKVKTFGEEHSIEKLFIPYWGATEQDGYEMAAISAYILKAIGFYRIPFDNGVQFYILFKNIKWSEHI